MCGVGWELMALGLVLGRRYLGVGVDVGLLGSTLLIFVSEPDETVAVPSLSFVCYAQPLDSLKLCLSVFSERLSLLVVAS